MSKFPWRNWCMIDYVWIMFTWSINEATQLSAQFIQYYGEKLIYFFV